MLEQLKVLKTLTTAEVLSLMNGSTVGVFTTAIENIDPYYTQAHGLALEYYLSHSAEKEVSATYYNIKAQLEAMPTVQKTVNELLGDICRNKFQNKWTKIYQALVLGEYDPLEDYTHFEHKTATNTDTVTYGKSTIRKDEYNSSVEDNGNTGTNQTVTTNYNDEDNTYGFNSSTPVGADNSSSTTTEQTVGASDSNTTHNKQDKTGNDTRTDTDSGSDKTDYDVNETIDKHGRNVGAQELLQKELDLRSQSIFYNIVFKDVDSVVASRIY